MSNASELLESLLRLAIPIHVERLRELPEDEFKAAAMKAGQTIAAKGDCFLRPSKTGEAAEAFNALALGLAALSLTTDGPLVERTIRELVEAIEEDGVT